MYLYSRRIRHSDSSILYEGYTLVTRRQGIDDECRKAGKGEGREAQQGRLEDRDTILGDSL
jgi:hypothetical protein